MSNGTMDKNTNRAPGRDLVLGVGDGGCCVLETMARIWRDAPEMVAVNTGFRTPPAEGGPRRALIGAAVMNGLGTGGDPRVGRRAAEADAALASDLVAGAGLVFLVVGLGGGTGTGAAPFLAEEARKAGAMVLCFAMLPFEFEGPQRMVHAIRGMSALKEASAGVVCLPNQRLFATLENRANIEDAFRTADEVMGRGIRTIWRVLAGRGIINIEFADIRALLHANGGQCVFGCAEAAGPDRVEAILKKLGADPVLTRDGMFEQARSYIVGICAGADLPLKDIELLLRGISKLGRADALAKVGVSCDPSMGENLSVAVLAAGQKETSAARTHPGSDGISGAPGIGAAPQGSSVMPGARAAKKLTQASLFESSVHGRFKDMDPTIVEGSNLDIPTFIRRGIMIRKIRGDAG